VQENCFGDRSCGRLCPASPAVRDYVLAMTRDLCRYPIAALRAEALHYQGSAHGHHHERCLEDFGEITRFLLGLCFCPACAGQAAGHDVDVPSLAARCRTYLAGVFDSAPDAPSLAAGPLLRGPGGPLLRGLRHLRSRGIMLHLPSISLDISTMLGKVSREAL
jgi:hypothetical protein